MGLLSAIGASDAPYLPFINTGTMVDLMTGAFVAGAEGNWVLNGGLGATNGVMGKPQVFKSTLALALMMNAAARCPGSEIFINDSEYSQSKTRLLETINLHHDAPEERAAMISKMSDNFVLSNPSQHDLETFMEEVKKLAAEKKRLIKDYTVEAPIIDPKTGKPQRMLIPTFVAIDSLSKARVKSAADMMDKYAASSPETNTMFMRENLAKTKIMAMIPRMAVEAGIYFMFTAHVGNKIDMSGSYGPPPKDMQYMKQGQSVKNVGSDFTFLVSNLIESTSATVLMDSDKECQYPLTSGLTGPTELSTVNAILVRCKNNSSGVQFKPVLSQTRGLETELTDYHYLRNNEYFGLMGSKINHSPIMCPDVKMTRTNAHTKLMDYKTARAIELLGQLCYIQNNWTIRGEHVQYRMTPEELTDALVKRSGYAMDDILNSRGWWTYGEHPRSYLSLFDVIGIASGHYKPKLIAVTPPKIKSK